MAGIIWFYILCGVIAYLLGSISFSTIFAKKLMHQDISKVGSGNAGTTNMLRSYGWKLGLLTLVCDAAKGVAAVFIASAIAGETGMYIAAVCCVGGHTWSCFLKFKGGKGIATTTGVLLVILPLQTIIVFGSCVGLVFLTKIMSIGSIVGVIASAVVPIIMYPENTQLHICVLLICAFALWAHRANIVRLFQGKENKLSMKKKKSDAE